jgi:lipopolysaccharide/colanic/teichoic acid biosynthesis glycosyltransferase
MPNRLYLGAGKRLLDLVLAVPGFILLIPVLLLITLLIMISDPGPVFFLQTRVGKNFKLFKLLKFRTMVINAEQAGPPVTGHEDPRITVTGKWLRRFKLDELPQVINVLKGEMSLVGPRPEIQKYVTLFADDYKTILTIRPGITDYAALEYRHEEKILDRFENLDQGYIKEILPFKIKLYKMYLAEISLLTDLQILFRTLGSIIR